MSWPPFVNAIGANGIDAGFCASTSVWPGHPASTILDSWAASGCCNDRVSACEHGTDAMGAPCQAPVPNRGQMGCDACAVYQHCMGHGGSRRVATVCDCAERCRGGGGCTDQDPSMVHSVTNGLANACVDAKEQDFPSPD
eukprot:gene54776-34653_t